MMLNKEYIATYKNDSKLFLLTCGLMIFYLSYRYPFGINSSTTSPTYIDTPLFLQVGKYVILAFVIILVLIHGVMMRMSKISIGTIFFSLSVMIFGLMKFLVYENFSFINQLPAYILPIILAGLLGRVNLTSLNHPIKWLFIISIMVDLVQVALFFLYDRLPALAYKNSFSVRFGSFLDDPNGFGMLCFLFIGWVHIYYKRFPRRRAFLQLITAMLITITQSLTAIGVGFIVFVFLYWRDKIFVSVILSTLTLALFFNMQEKILVLWELKQASIEQHSDVSFSSDNLIDILFGMDYSSTESWWFFSFKTNGILVTLLVFFLCCYCLYKTYVMYRKCICVDSQAVSFSIFLFSVCFFMASFNLPLLDVFPVNFLCFFMWAIVVLDKFEFKKKISR